MHISEKFGLAIAAIGFYSGMVDVSSKEAGYFVLVLGLAIFAGYRKVVE